MGGYELFMQTIRLENKSKETIRTYEKAVQCYANYVRERNLQVDGKSVMDFLVWMREGNRYAPSSVRLYATILKRFFDINNLPWPKMRLPKVSLGAPKFMPKDDFKKVYDQTEDDVRLRALVSICYATAMRVGELLTRKRAEIDLDKARVFVSGKTGPESDNWLPLNNTAVRDARAYLVWREQVGLPPLKPGDYFFHATDNLNEPMPYTTANAEIHSLCRRAGVKEISWHKVRHSRATHLRQDKTPMEDIKDLLRHTNISTTMRYARADTESIRESTRGKGELSEEKAK